MIPEATGTSRRSGGKGSIFFSYAWNDDASGYISAFHEAFVRRLGTKLRGQPQALAALGVEDADELVFFDQTNRAYMGSVRDWLKQRASAASFLVIFIDDDYLSSDWCLFEWECFQADFGQAALERLLIVELDKGLLDRHARELRQQATVGSINRADRLGLVSQCIRNAFYYEDGRRITARMNLNGKWPLNDEFVQQVEPLADEVLGRLQTPRSPGADPPVEGVDVIIGVSTADLGTSTAALEELLQRADVSVDHVTAEQIQGWTQEEGEAFFARGKALILPFSFRKINLLPMMRGGGHLRVQAEWFKRPDNLIWWRPPDGVGPEAEGDEVEQREAHRPTLNGLVAGEFPVAGGGQRLIAGGPDLVMRALQQGTSGASDAVKIVWESNTQVAKEIACCLEYTRQRWQRKFTDLDLNVRAYDLDWLFDNVENLRTIQGVMILGFSKAPYEIDDIIDRLDKYIRRTRARLAQRSIVINDKPRVFWPKHIRFDVPNATDPSLVEVDPVENLEGFFNDIHELAKQTSKPSS